MSKIQSENGYPDATEGNVDLLYYPGEERVEEVTFPMTARERLIEEMEASKQWELSKFTDQEIKAEYLRRHPF